jgi:hypothetical protein
MRINSGIAVLYKIFPIFLVSFEMKRVSRFPMWKILSNPHGVLFLPLYYTKAYILGMYGTIQNRLLLRI